MMKYEYLKDYTAEKVFKAKVNATTKAHKMSPTLERDLQLYAVFTFRSRHQTIKTAELLRLAVYQAFRLTT